MPQGAEQYLNNLVSQWTPPETYFSAHRRHRASIEETLDAHCGIFRMLETGSLRHGTGIRVHSDADYFASMKGSRPTPETALLRIKTVLANRFHNTAVQIRQPTVKCLFVGGHETVEVAPAFRADSGFWIPNPRGGWMKSHPSDHNDYVNSANQYPTGAAKRLARLAKIWKYQRNVPISSFYLEMRAAQFANNISGWVGYIDLYDFLVSLQRQRLADMNDPTRLTGRFSACSSDANNRDALSKLDMAVIRAGRAYEAERAGHHPEACEAYAKLFNV